MQLFAQVLFPNMIFLLVKNAQGGYDPVLATISDDALKNAATEFSNDRKYFGDPDHPFQKLSSQKAVDYTKRKYEIKPVLKDPLKEYATKICLEKVAKTPAETEGYKKEREIIAKENEYGDYGVIVIYWKLKAHKDLNPNSAFGIIVAKMRSAYGMGTTPTPSKILLYSFQFNGTTIICGEFNGAGGGAGGNSVVKSVVEIDENKGKDTLREFVVKTELNNKAKPVIQTEAEFYEVLKDSDSFPKKYFYGADSSDPNRVMLIMDLLGPNLEEVKEALFQEFEAKDIKWIGSQIIAIMISLAEKNIIHRDIKFDNLVLGNKDPKSLKLIDFGFAMCATSLGDETAPRSDPDRELAGTLEFMCSEAHSAYKGYKYTLWTDVANVLNLLYYGMRGFPPFNESDIDTPGEIPEHPAEKLEYYKRKSDQIAQAKKKFTLPAEGDDEFDTFIKQKLIFVRGQVEFCQKNSVDVDKIRREVIEFYKELQLSEFFNGGDGSYPSMNYFTFLFNEYGLNAPYEMAAAITTQEIDEDKKWFNILVIFLDGNR